MLAGEPFSDRPATVCRVIAAVLRGYNDIVDTPRRQALYGAAAEVLETRGSEHLERARLEHCLAAVHELEPARRRSLRWRLRSRSPRHIRRLRSRAESEGAYIDQFGQAVARFLTGGAEAGHERMVSLVGELVAIGEHAALPLSAPQASPSPAPATP